jgi:chromosome partitioning protein
MAKIIAVVTHKGGVGKTFTSVNLSDALAREGQNVLLCDLDPQANATKLVYSFEQSPPAPIERVLSSEATIAEGIITSTNVRGVHLLGSTIKLANLERTIQNNPFTSTRLLSQKLKSVEDVYDIIILDCPPSLGGLTANALAAADMAIVPVESGSKLSLTGSDDTLAFISEARNINPRLTLGGALLTMHDGRKTVCRIIANGVRASYDEVFETTIPASTDVQKGQILNKTILQFDKDHTVTRAVVDLAREVMAKIGVQAKEVAHAE